MFPFLRAVIPSCLYWLFMVSPQTGCWLNILIFQLVCPLRSIVIAATSSLLRYSLPPTSVLVFNPYGVSAFGRSLHIIPVPSDSLNWLLNVSFITGLFPRQQYAVHAILQSPHAGRLQKIGYHLIISAFPFCIVVVFPGYGMCRSLIFPCSNVLPYYPSCPRLSFFLIRRTPQNCANACLAFIH